MTSLKETALFSSSFQKPPIDEKVVKYQGKIWTIIKKKSAKMQSLEKTALKAVKEFGYSYQTCIGLTIFDVLRLKKKIIFLSKS